VAPEPRDLASEQGPGSHGGVAVRLQRGDRRGRFARQIFPATIESRGGADFQIGDAGVGGVETPALLPIAGDRQRQRPLGPLDGCGRIAHLLIEDEESLAALEFFFRHSHAAS